MTETADKVEITGRIFAELLRDTHVDLTRFNTGHYIVGFTTGRTQFQVHLDQDDVDQLHALFARFAKPGLVPLTDHVRMAVSNSIPGPGS